MSSLPTEISARIEAVAGIDPELRPATKPQFGHYQCNVAMRLAKTEGAPPRQIAERLVGEIDLADLCEPLEIAGPGFINIRIRAEVLAGRTSEIIADPHHGIVSAEPPATVVIDYSSPNVAKQMHVGHLRSTIIGDCFNRTLSASGNTVVAQNHIGDWGTQFGMLVEEILEAEVDVPALDLPGTEALYKQASAHFKSDEAFAERARARVVQLQAGDEETTQIWTQLLEVSRGGFAEAYRRLGVLLTDDDLAGESTYNADLPVVARELEESGVAVIDDGALCVFVDGFEAPLIVRKRGGGFGYAVTDLAAIRHRVRTLGADRIIYVTDLRQASHFQQVFAVARRAGYLPEGVRAEHVGFGMVLGPDGKPFKTRDGSAASLASLLDAAEEQASPPIALAAIKYADLSTGLQKDYVFDPERMAQTTGNTGPYLQYAHARCCQVLRKAEAEQLDTEHVTVLGEPAEQQLALLLTRFGEVVAELGEHLQPHKLCTYLYEVSEAYSVFYEHCPVLKSEGEVRTSRLGLCRATQQVLAHGLSLLGIPAPDRM